MAPGPSIYRLSKILLRKAIVQIAELLRKVARCFIPLPVACWIELRGLEIPYAGFLPGMRIGLTSNAMSVR